jgi:hypothetical protein
MTDLDAVTTFYTRIAYCGEPAIDSPNSVILAQRETISAPDTAVIA